MVRESLRRFTAKAVDLKWDLLGLYLARNDPRVPFRAKLAISVAIGYALSPIDLIPDFIPVLGKLDDLVIVPMLVRYALRQVPPDVFTDYRAKAQVRFATGTPSFYGMVGVVLLVWSSIIIAMAIFVFHLV